MTDDEFQLLKYKIQRLKDTQAEVRAKLERLKTLEVKKALTLIEKVW